MDRFTYQQRAKELAPRGADLPQTKLTDADVSYIRQAQAKRDQMRQEINDRWSNAALAQQLGVHVRTVEKVLAYETHITTG